MKIISDTAHPALPQSNSECLQAPLCDATVTAFPDGETFVKINENIRGRDLFIIQPSCPPTNANLMELLFTVDVARRSSASRITAVIPFFGYACEDQSRVPITSRWGGNLLTGAGDNGILTMDLPAGRIQGFFDISGVAPRVLDEAGIVCDTRVTNDFAAVIQRLVVDQGRRTAFDELLTGGAISSR